MMVSTMGRMADAFWRAVAYCLHPRVIALSLLPLLIAAALTTGLAYAYWEDAVRGMRGLLESWLLVESLLRWLDAMGGGGFRAVIAPLLVLALTVPAVMVLSLLLVALFMTPAIVKLVAQRRFPGLERKRGAAWWQGMLWSLLCSIGALAALLASLPLWLIPPLVLLVPPLIWGWLSYRVFSFDVLAEHASADERHRLMREHRLPLLVIGVVTGYLGAAPSLIWALSMMAVVMAPFLALVTVWLYTVVFAFSALWFAHYALAALDAQRSEAARRASLPGDAAPVPAPAASPQALPPAAAEPQSQPALPTDRDAS